MNEWVIEWTPHPTLLLNSQKVPRKETPSSQNNLWHPHCKPYLQCVALLQGNNATTYDSHTPQFKASTLQHTALTYKSSEQHPYNIQLSHTNNQSSNSTTHNSRTQILRTTGPTHDSHTRVLRRTGPTHDSHTRVLRTTGLHCSLY